MLKANMGNPNIFRQMKTKPQTFHQITNLVHMEILVIIYKRNNCLEDKMFYFTLLEKNADSEVRREPAPVKDDRNDAP